MFARNQIGRREMGRWVEGSVGEKAKMTTKVIKKISIKKLNIVIMMSRKIETRIWNGETQHKDKEKNLL
jgi:hypothetical protein